MTGDSGSSLETEKLLLHEGQLPEDEQEDEDDECGVTSRTLSRHAPQKEWRQGRIMTGREKVSRQTGHCKEDLSSSTSLSMGESSRDGHCVPAGPSEQQCLPSKRKRSE